MVISAGALALILFLALWLVFGHFWWGIIVALIVVFFSGGVGYYRRP